MLASRRFAKPVLDLGCGDGIFAKVLFSEPVDVGLDPNERELGVARSLGVYTKLVERGGDDIDAPDGYFRTVFSNSVLEHIPDLRPVLREVHRVLDHGGRFYVTLPTDRIEDLNLGSVGLRPLGARIGRKWLKVFRKIWRLHNVHPVEEWVQIFRETGFEIEDAIEYQTLRMYRVREAVLPLSIPAFFLKRIANRWLFLPPRMRRVLLRRAAGRVKASADRATPGEPNCLLFLALRKAD